jgi:hypothetical protein
VKLARDSTQEVLRELEIQWHAWKRALPAVAY